MNFSLYQAKGNRPKQGSLLGKFENKDCIEELGLGGRRTPFKAVRTLPDTPEQFLRSGSFSNKSQGSCRSYAGHSNIFESPKLMDWEGGVKIDTEKQVKRLESLVKNKEKRINEQEMLINAEKEELRRDKCELERKFLKKKEEFKKIKQKLREEREELDNRMEEIDLKFLEVKEMVLKFEADKEEFREKVREEVYKELKIGKENEKKLELQGIGSEKKREKHEKVPSFSVDSRDFYTYSEEADWKKKREQKILYSKIEDSQMTEKNLTENNWESLEHEDQTDYAAEEKLSSHLIFIKKLQRELEFYQSKCKSLENQLESLPSQEALTQIQQALLSKDAEIYSKIEILSSEQARMTQQSLKISVELQTLQKKESDLAKLAAELNQKESELSSKTQELEKASLLINSINEELANEKKKQEETQEDIQNTLEKLKKVAAKQLERETLIKLQEEKLNPRSF